MQSPPCCCCCCGCSILTWPAAATAPAEGAPFPLARPGSQRQSHPARLPEDSTADPRRPPGYQTSLLPPPPPPPRTAPILVQRLLSPTPALGQRPSSAPPCGRVRVAVNPVGKRARQAAEGGSPLPPARPSAGAPREDAPAARERDEKLRGGGENRNPGSGAIRGRAPTEREALMYHPSEETIGLIGGNHLAGPLVTKVG